MLTLDLPELEKGLSHKLLDNPKIGRETIPAMFGAAETFAETKEDNYVQKVFSMKNVTFGASTVQGSSVRLGYFLKPDLGDAPNILVTVSANSNNNPYSLMVYDSQNRPIANLTQTSGRNAVVITPEKYDIYSFPMSVLLYTEESTVLELNDLVVTIGGTDSTSIERFIYYPDFQPLTSLGMDLRYPEFSYEREGRVLYPELKYVIN